MAEVSKALNNISDENAKMLYELIKEKILDVKIVLKDGGLYHDKLAVLRTIPGILLLVLDQITKPGYDTNYEKIRVYKGWTDIEGRIDDEANEFESIWNDDNDYLAETKFYAIYLQALKNYEHVIVITTINCFFLERYVNLYDKVSFDKLLIVDESRNFANKIDDTLSKKYKFKLGLSATPVFGNNEEKTRLLLD